MTLRCITGISINNIQVVEELGKSLFWIGRSTSSIVSHFTPNSLLVTLLSSIPHVAIQIQFFDFRLSLLVKTCSHEVKTYISCLGRELGCLSNGPSSGTCCFQQFQCSHHPLDLNIMQACSPALLLHQIHSRITKTEADSKLVLKQVQKMQQLFQCGYVPQSISYDIIIRCGLQSNMGGGQYPGLLSSTLALFIEILSMSLLMIALDNLYGFLETKKVLFFQVSSSSTKSLVSHEG